MSSVSPQPHEFKAMVDAVHMPRAALGRVTCKPKPSEGAGRNSRRSLYAVPDIAPGALLTGANVRAIRPGVGLPPKHLDGVIGGHATRAIARGEQLDWSLLSAPGRQG